MSGTKKVSIAGNGSRTRKSKDGNDIVDMSEFSSNIRYLRKNASMPLNKLNKDVSKVFDTVVMQLKTASNTDEYKNLIATVRTIFLDESESGLELVQGTIGAYFAGCLIKSDGPNGNKCCNPICAGNLLPALYEQEYVPCPFTVVHTDGNGTFHINAGVEAEKALIYYVNPGRDVSKISKEELDTFKDYGINEARVFVTKGHKDNFAIVKEINGYDDQFHPIQFFTNTNIKFRGKKNSEPSCDTCEDSHSASYNSHGKHKKEGWGWGWLLLIIIIVIILLIACFCGGGRRYSNYATTSYGPAYVY